MRLSDVASAVEGAENTKLAGWMNTTEAVILNIQRQPGANVIEVVDRIQALLPQLRAALPAAVDVAVLTDRTTTIRASVADVEFELGLAVVLVVLVIFLFLRSPSATIIPSLSVPLSLVGTLAVMYLAGFSLNNLSLMAMTIATGFVVDDAIVMIENISRYIEAGDPPLQAALKGSEQIGFTIISLTVSLIAVLIPLLFMADVVGRLFREFAHHARGDDHHFGDRVADPGADDVRQAAAPSTGRSRCRGSRARARNGSTPGSHSTGRLLDWVLDRQALTLLRRRRDAGADRVLLRRDPERVLPGAGYRADPGHLRGVALGVVRRDGRAAAGAGRRDPQGSRRRQPVVVHRGRRHQYARSTPAAC